MENWIANYNLLSNEEKKEVSDFVQFIVSKKQRKKSGKSQLKNWKRKLLTVSMWSKKDLKVFEEHHNLWKSWKPQEW